MDKALTIVFAFAFLLCFGFAFAEAQPWDFLRPLNNAAEAFSGFTTWIVLILSAALMVIAVLAYRKTQSKRHAFIALAFVFFFIKWLLAAADLYLSPGRFFSWAGGTVAELVIFACLFIALFKR